MKNINKHSLKTCIFLDENEFTEILSNIFSGEITVDCDYEGIRVEHDGECINSDELFWKLEEYFDVARITSLHIDDCDTVGIWITYKEYDTSVLPHLATNDMAELRGQVVDIFEDFASENNIYIPNEDRDAEIAEVEADGIPVDELGLAIIYGDDYDTIASVVESAIQRKAENYDNSLFTDEEINGIVNDTCNAFKSVSNYQITDEYSDMLSHRLKNTLINWCLCECPIIQIPD